MKKAECRRIDAFKLLCSRRLLKVSYTASSSNQSILKEINPEYSFRKNWWLKLKHQYFGHLVQRADSLEKTLMLERLRAGGKEGDRGWDGWMAASTQWTWVWASSGRWWRTGKPGMLQSMGWQRDGHDLVTEQQQQITLHSTHMQECPYILCPLTSALRTIWNMRWKLHFILSLHYLCIWRRENRVSHHRKWKIIKSRGIECVLKNGKSQSHIVYDMTHNILFRL